jgi:SAM-dependent methyltransferase
MGASGKEVVAIDISSSAVRRATKHPNVRFLNCSIEEFESETGFDAVLLLDVIEHLGQPLRVLHRIHTLLNPEGLIVVCTPNSTSGIKRVKRLIGMKEVLPPCHEQEFSWKGLRCALASSGFRVTYATGCLLGPKRLLPVRWLNELNIRAGVIAPSVAQVMVAVGRK